MVEVPGGPFVLPAAVTKDQPDMGGLGIACVAPFKIDRTEVTNKQYLDFWLTLPESDRKRLGFQSNYMPSTWSKTGAPYLSSVADLPVIGVPMPGALAYAKAHGKRLPTPYEWALAALGPRGEASVDWVKRYVDDRNQTWGRVKAAHIQYLQLHPEIQQEIYFAPTHFDLPWMAAGPALQSGAKWSRQTVVETCEPLWQTWKNPPYLEPVGTRDYDVSPFGARDMLLNASELVQPYPGGPINGRPRWVELDWIRREPTDKDPWHARTLPSLKQIEALPPLSRLTRRALLSPPTDELVSLSNMSEILSMLAPLQGWSLRMTSDMVVTAEGLIPRRQVGQAVLNLPGFDLYAERPRHYREEIGLPIPLDHTDRSPSAGPQLYYAAPTGFRCVR
jgi:formylglycine-generating enzyme required for sulfatase activity